MQQITIRTGRHRIFLEFAATLGPTRVWVEAEADGSVQTIGKYDYEHGRGMSVGRKT